MNMKMNLGKVFIHFMTDHRRRLINTVDLEYKEINGPGLKLCYNQGFVMAKVNEKRRVGLKHKLGCSRQSQTV